MKIIKPAACILGVLMISTAAFAGTFTCPQQVSYNADSQTWSADQQALPTSQWKFGMTPSAVSSNITLNFNNAESIVQASSGYYGQAQFLCNYTAGSGADMKVASLAYNQGSVYPAGYLANKIVPANWSVGGGLFGWILATCAESSGQCLLESE